MAVLPSLPEAWSARTAARSSCNVQSGLRLRTFVPSGCWMRTRTVAFGSAALLGSAGMDRLGNTETHQTG